MRTPAHTLDGLEQEIAKAATQAKTGAKFLNLDTRVIEWLIQDARALWAIEHRPSATPASPVSATNLGAGALAVPRPDGQRDAT